MASHKSGQSIPSAADFGQTRAYLARLGLKTAEINAAVGTNVNGRTWAVIGDALIAWLKTR